MNESFALGSERHFTRNAILLFWLAAAMLALGVSPWWRIASDSALYIGIAQSLAAGHGYTFSGDLQSSIPPLLPLSFALIYKVALVFRPGMPITDAFLYFNAFVAAFAVVGFIAAFFLILELGGRRWAILILLLLVTNNDFYFRAIQPLTDAPYAALSWAALLFFIWADRRGGALNYIAASVFLVLALLTRLVGIALVITLAGYLVIRYFSDRRQREKAIKGAFTILPSAIIMLATIYVIWHFRRTVAFNYWNELLSWQRLPQMIVRAASNLATIPEGVFQAVTGAESVGGVGVLLCMLIAAGATICWRKGMRLAVAYFVVYFLYVAAGEAVLQRYVAPMLPFAFLFILEGATALVAHLGRFSDSEKPAKAIRAVLTVFLVGFIVANVVYSSREIRINFSRDFYKVYRSGKNVDYLTLSKALVADPPKGRILAFLPREVTVFTGLPTAWMSYQYKPTNTYSPTWEHFERFISDRDVAAIVVDPEYTASADYLSQFVVYGPLQWRQAGCFGRLTLYTLEGARPKRHVRNR